MTYYQNTHIYKGGDITKLNEQKNNQKYNNKKPYNQGKYNGKNKVSTNREIVNNSSTSQEVQQLINNDISYCSDFLKAYNSQSFSGQNYLLSPQLLNATLKNVNMDGYNFSTDQIRKMVMSPHNFEQELRKLSYHYFNYIAIYKRNIEYKSTVLDFDWEPIPYTLDGKPITQSDITSNAFKQDYAEMTKFFNNFNVKQEFQKVLFNMLLYDTYYTSTRTYDGHIYLQELPSTHCMIDANSYLGYLFSFDLSYFMNSGVDINAYSPALRKKYSEVLKLKKSTYNPNLPQRNGSWVYWHPMTPDDAWVFKFNNNFAGSVPPLLDMLIDYSKIDKFKELEEAKKQLEAYKVIFATVPRLTNNKSANKVDDFAISSTELGKFVAAVKQTLGSGVDFKAAPLEDFKAFDFSPSASENDLLETEINNMLKESGTSDSILTGGSSVSSNNIYKLVTSEIVKTVYPQFANYCEYQINKNTKKYKFKIKFVGTIFDREDRRKAANEDMERGIITPAIFSSRGIQMTDATNISNMMYGLGYPDLFRPIKTASTMSSDEKSVGGRPQSDDNHLTDSGEQTRNIGANDNREKDGV